MKASFNGARRSLSVEFNDLLRCFDEKPSDKIIARLNGVRHYIVALNCMYDPDIKDDCDEVEQEVYWADEYFDEREN